MPTVLIVEDEPQLLDSVAFAFEQEGYRVVTAHDGVEGRDAFVEHNPDLVILDLMLPAMSGDELCRFIRSRAETPIIVVSARDAELDRVLLLEIGADDYLTKPFSIRELLVRARKRLGRPSSGESAPGRIHVGPLTLDAERHELIVDGAPVPLTPREFALMELLMSKPGRVRTRREILARVWHDEYISDKSIDVYVKRLREKLGSYAHLIKNVRSVGYRLEG